VSKRIDDRTFEKFVQDVKSLRAVYTDAKICAAMGTNAGNFSSRVNGVKRPGRDFIDRFYQSWGKKLVEMANTGRNDVKETYLLASGNPKREIPGYSLYDDERIRCIEASLSRLDTFTGGLIEQLIVSHLKLVDAHLAILSQYTKSAGNRPCE
jgi:hypothetical protein